MLLVFAHNYLFNNWENVVREQLDKLVISDLYSSAQEINYCVYSENEKDYENFISILKSYDTKNKINIIRHQNNEHEIETLYFLQNRIRDISSEEKSYVLYYHTKGVTSEINHADSKVDMNCVTSWRRLLEYFCIELWHKSISVLKDGYDTSGSLYISDSGQYYHNYYSGNFWWATSDYIKTLPDIKDEYKKQLSINKDLGRMVCEKWIGMSQHRWFSFYSQHLLNIYNTFFDKSLYRNIINKKNDVLIIVDGYVDSNIKERIMIDCINSFKKTGCDIMSISHKHLPKSIETISDYIFTDNSNIYFTDDTKRGIKTFATTEKFLVENYYHSELYTHVPNVLIGIYNAVKIAKHSGYKYFFCTSYDFILDEKDISKFDDMIKYLEFKDGVFFGGEIPEQNEVFLSTHTLCNCDYFLENILPIKDENDWWENCSKLGEDTYAIEIYIGANLKNKLHDIKILDKEASRYFNNSNTNLVSSGSIINILRMIDKTNNKFYPNIISFVYNTCELYGHYETVNVNIFKMIDNEYVNVFKLKETPMDGDLHFTLFEMEYNINYKVVISDTKTVKEREFFLNTNNINQLDNYGYVKLF